MLGQMLAKVVLSAVLVPPLVYLFVGFGRRLEALMQVRAWQNATVRMNSLTDRGRL